MKRLFTAAILAALLLLVAAPAFAAETIPVNDPSSGTLVNKPKLYNGKRVTFTGEAIGEVMVRGGYAWVHLNDDAYMERNVEEGAPLKGYNSGMAIWVPADLTKQIDTYGDYKHEGSIVRISGTFNAACKEHGGDMDIHADTLTVIRAGHPVSDPVPPWKAGVAVLLVAAAGGLWSLERATRTWVRPHRGV